MSDQNDKTTPERDERAADSALSASPGSPRRVQRKRVKGWRMPPNTVSVCRPGKWGNPFKAEEFRWTRPDPEMEIEPRRRSDEECQAEAVAIYENWLPLEKIEEAKRELRGKNLACYCKPGTPCHADVLLRVANNEPSR